jgi:hypothetical protein
VGQKPFHFANLASSGNAYNFKQIAGTLMKYFLVVCGGVGICVVIIIIVGGRVVVVVVVGVVVVVVVVVLN